jgi:uncharacterized protein YcnI
MRWFRALGLTGLLGGVTASALAHIVLTEPEAVSGGYYAGFFRVSHGCGASDTLSIRIAIPESVTIAKPQPKPGWSIAIEHEPLNPPIGGEGGRIISERVSAISWTGRLPADQFDQFGVVMNLPATPGPIYFPTIQTCQNGQNSWVNIPQNGRDWHSVANPAPMLMLTRSEPMSAMHAGH